MSLKIRFTYFISHQIKYLIYANESSLENGNNINIFFLKKKSSVNDSVCKIIASLIFIRLNSFKWVKSALLK